jgi:pimeloyl-ACP methyl ester carboxylesterase
VAVVEDLHALLEGARCRPPYVLVGDSLGGLYVRGFATMHPTEVAGLVLVDGTHERQFLEWDRWDQSQGLPPESSAAKRIGELKARGDNTTADELQGLADVWSTGNLGLPGKLSDVPMVVITGTRPDRPPEFLKIWRSLQGEMFSATTHGRHVVTNKSGHTITADEPDLVVSEIRWVVEAARLNQSGKTGQ